MPALLFPCPVALCDMYVWHTLLPGPASQGSAGVWEARPRVELRLVLHSSACLAALIHGRAAPGQLLEPNEVDEGPAGADEATWRPRLVKATAAAAASSHFRANRASRHLFMPPKLPKDLHSVARELLGGNGMPRQRPAAACRTPCSGAPGSMKL